jgi:RsiW-degrading membrane proteinase PrsW (M82 family)
MTNQQFSIEKRIEIDRVDNLYKRSKTASLTLLVISTIYVLLLTKKFNWQPLLAWYLILIVVLSGRWLMARFYARDHDRDKFLSFWLNMFRLGILAAGLTIGSRNVFFFP